MDFRFCELSAAIGYATCYYENQPDSDLEEALSIALDEFIVPCDRDIDEVTMAALVSHLDIATKEYQSEAERAVFDGRDDEDEDEDEDEEEDEDQE